MGDRVPSVAQLPRLKRRHFVRCALAIALLVSCRVTLAQSSPAVPDPIQSAVTQAIRDGRFVDAEKLLTNAINELEQSDASSPRLAGYFKNLSSLLNMRGDRSDAIALTQHALEIDRNAFGPSDLRITNDLVAVASYSRIDGNLQEAEQLLTQALEIARSNSTKLNSGSAVDSTAAVFGSLASLYITEHRWTEAEPLLLEESKLCDFFEEPYRAGYALCGSLPARLAEVYRAEGRTVDADQLPRDEGLPAELVALNSIAEKYEKDGLYPSAEDTYNRAIALAEKLDADPQNRYGGLIAREVNSLGQLFEKEGLKDRAEKTYARALEINEKLASQRGRTGYAVTLNPRYLIDLYRSEGRLKDAEPVLQRVLEIQEQSLGERHRMVVQTLTTLAGVYQEEGKNDRSQIRSGTAFVRARPRNSAGEPGARQPAVNRRAIALRRYSTQGAQRRKSHPSPGAH
jgi:tetratricopeptide (TPR) repeat protein